MKYKEKIKHAELVAEELSSDKSLEVIKAGLKEKGLFERDINNVIASARNILGEQLKPIIREKLLAKESLTNTKELEKIDSITLEKMVKQEFQSIALGEKRKVIELLEKGTPPNEVFSKIRLDFYPEASVAQQIAAFNEVKKQNSAGGRTINIVGGLALILIGGGISIASMQSGGGGRIFYGAVIVGFIMLIKGFITAKNPD